MSRAQVPPGIRDLASAERRGPAAQDAERSPERDPAERCYYDDLIKLPGYGYQPERCMAFQPVGFCEAEGHPVLGSSSCGTRYCPVHWDDWKENAVAGQVARLAAYRHAQSGAGKRLLHVVVSPDPDRWWTAEAFWDARTEAYEVAEATGARGGVVYPHPYRTSDDGDHLFETAVESGDWEEDWGKWSLLRDAADDWGEMQDLTEPGPHYHMLAPARDFDPDAIPAGWVAKNIRSLPRFDYRDLEAYRPMAQVASYLLTHAAVQDGRNTVTYWGEVHPNAFDPAEAVGAERWAEIQEKAELAVTTRPAPGASEMEGTEPETCPRDGCEGEIVPIEDLHEYIDDPEWTAGIDEKHLYQLHGLQAWAAGMTDRPPPTTDEQPVLRWLYEQGRTAAATWPGLTAEQVGLGDFRSQSGVS